MPTCSRITPWPSILRCGTLPLMSSPGCAIISGWVLRVHCHAIKLWRLTAARAAGTFAVGLGRGYHIFRLDRLPRESKIAMHLLLIFERMCEVTTTSLSVVLSSLPR